MFFHPKKIFTSPNIRREFREVAIEAQNRNLSPQMVMQYFHSKQNPERFAISCKALYDTVRGALSDDLIIDELINMRPKELWQTSALFFGNQNGEYNKDLLATRICESAVIANLQTIDEYIESLPNRQPYEDRGIAIDDEGLTDLSDKHFEFTRSGIVINDGRALYPHQFFRRGFSGNILGTPFMLLRARHKGAKVKIRIDPYRETTADKYFECIELDDWYGPKFSNKLLDDPTIAGRTVHFSTGIYDTSYDVRFTVFRTKLMDAGIREFMIEEYCPLNLAIGTKSPGTGSKSCIQKFAHFCYDQQKKCFIHLDGAVRVFPKDEYESVFKIIESGNDIGDKAGIRYKMFLVEGELEIGDVQNILTEWFRMNSHIHEYFSGEKIKPPITYNQLEKIVARQKD